MNIKKLSDTFAKVGLGAFATGAGAAGLGLMVSAGAVATDIMGYSYHVTDAFANVGMGISAVGAAGIGAAIVCGVASEAVKAGVFAHNHS
jgi:hypothetical protein